MTDTQAQERLSPPLTPSELAAPKPLIHRAINHRVETLLTARRPAFFSCWLASMEEAKEGPNQNPKWGIMLLYIAAALPLERRGGFDWEAPLPSKQERQIERNRRLLITLAYRGCKNRGEFS